MIGLCLLTCDRPAYTQRTLETLAAHNDLRRFHLFHADDASADPTNGELARQYGFTTVVQQKKRQGNVPTRTALLEAAAPFAKWLWLLENDIETVRPFPWALWDVVHRLTKVDSLRLYGAYKDRARREACLTTHKTGRKPVKWRRWHEAPEPAEIGRIHWSAQPSVTRTQALLDLHQRGQDLAGQTVRVLENVTYHIGVERTVAA